MKILNLVSKDIRIFSSQKSTIVLTFIVPMIIILIFGAVFGGFGNSNGISKISLYIADESQNDLSEKLIKKLNQSDQIKAYSKYKKNESFTNFDKDTLLNWIKKGKIKVGLVIPDNLEKNVELIKPIKLEIFYDSKNKIEYNIVQGVLKQIFYSSFSDYFNKMIKKKIYSSLDVNDSKIKAHISEFMRKSVNSQSIQEEFSNFLQIESKSIIQVEQENAMFVQYVAGMAVMFLLFSVSHGGATILEERKEGTLKRLLTLPVSYNKILFSKAIFTSTVGIVQLIVLFIFGWIIFGLDIFSHIPSLLVMIIFTALACSSLGIFIAAISKTQQQVNSLSTLIILGMSALGGSMFPSFLMPPYIKTIGKFTVNFWAMKGFNNIFWRNLGLTDIWDSILILFSIFIFLTSISFYLFKKKIES